MWFGWHLSVVEQVGNWGGRPQHRASLALSHRWMRTHFCSWAYDRWL